MSHDVFISYSSKDKPIADAICANLEASGVRCWIAPRDIAPGEDWPTAIADAIPRCQIMVLVFSAHSNSSVDVGRELFLAANSKLVIIPFKIENVEPEPGKRYYLARTHWLDAVNPPTQEQIQELVNRVKVLIPPKEPTIIGNQTESELSPRSTTKPASNKGRISRWFWSVPIGVILLGLLGWAAFSLFLKHPAAPIQPTSFPTFTPSLTATTTPTIIPTPTATSTEPVQARPTISAGTTILFQDAFDSNANGWDLGIQSDASGDVTKQIIDGKYRLSLTSKQKYFFDISFVPNFSAKDFLFSIDATILDTNATTGDLALYFSLREVNGVNGKHYDFIFYNDNAYAVDAWPSADSTTVKSVLTGNMLTTKLEKGVTNTFAIQANGSTFTIYINGNKIDSFTDTTINEAGSMSLWLGLYKPNQTVTMEFDNLIIKSIP